MDTKIDIYSTKDLSESAILIVKGQKLDGVEWRGQTCWFNFKNAKVCEDISNKYFCGELIVNARSLVEMMRSLKNRVSTRG